MARLHSTHLPAGALAAAALLLAASSVATGPTKLPPGFKVCVRDQEDTMACLEEAVPIALKLLGSGVPDFGIPPMDPLYVPQLSIGDDNKDAPVNLLINFTDIKIYNLPQAKALKVNLDLPNYQMSAHGYIDKMYAEANYVMDGKILLIPAKGEGKVYINATHLEVDIGVQGVKNVKNNKEYLKVTEFPLEFIHLGKLDLQFDNLFNGDKTLGPSVNNVINENWQEIWSQLKVPLRVIFQHTFKEYARRIFDKVALEDIFLIKSP